EGTFGQRFSISRPVLLAAPRLLAFDSNGSSDGSSGEPKDALGYRRDFLLVQEGAAGPGEVEADLVWVRGEEYGAVRLAGQIVLRRPTGDLPGEIAQAISHGAAGLILAGNRAEKALVAKEPLTARPALAPEETIPVVEVTEDGLQRLLAAGDYSLRDLNEAPPAMPLDLRVRLEVPISLERTNSTNVLGFLPGADPDLRQEVVIIGAGYDYAGDDPDDEVCLSGGACLDLPGFKYPGANDASGVGVLLEVARLWQESGYRPARSVLFAAWGAETLGQAGSRFYAAHPAVPLTQTVALVELDAIGGGSGYYLQAQGDPNREAVLRFSIAAAARQIEGRLDLVKSSRSGAQETFRAVGVPAMLVYWKGAAQKSLPADLADKIDSYRLGVTGRAVALTLMMLAR
ncbi:MAG: M28 family metallopeptidase, partial [Anaerolineae bacterium]